MHTSPQYLKLTLAVILGLVLGGVVGLVINRVQAETTLSPNMLEVGGGAGIDQLRISHGAVGIGTDIPIAFDVAGDVNISGRVRVDGIIHTSSLSREVNSGTRSASATCPAGKQMLGGGCNSPRGDLKRSRPNGNGWECERDSRYSVTAYVICW